MAKSNKQSLEQQFLNELKKYQPAFNTLATLVRTAFDMLMSYHRHS